MGVPQEEAGGDSKGQTEADEGRSMLCLGANYITGAMEAACARLPAFSWATAVVWDCQIGINLWLPAPNVFDGW